MTKKIAGLMVAASVLFAGATLHAQGETFAARAAARLHALEVSRGVSASAPGSVSPVG